ncbi:MAG: glycosyltransferase family 4 protein [Chloroflexi bacterium]|uniref:Glycosyltransferase family 4 protein n=1 Tax=Candidatus Chlorohelix allophototropha TaxID=3003348 RepID=A0A8T7LSM2_9CHLR|nr:glycosyltransferase family 4 protein [Chloroflexota bacterium]WJW66909.1 glycosyltransferase family 4 protein [Chloroflexota bacterium L227-S17]
MSNRKKLNIALLAPLVSPIAQPFIGGAQAMLHDMALELARRGHKVTLFAAPGSKIEATNPVDAALARQVTLAEVPVKPGELIPADFSKADGYRESDEAFFRQSELFLQTYLRINRAVPTFDIAHAMAYDLPAFAFAPLSGVPTVHTLHIGALDARINSILRTTYLETGKSRATTVSKACAATYAPYFEIDRVIYNAIDTAAIPFGEKGEGFLLFAGRITPEKGPDLAIEIARMAGKKLVLAGGIYDSGFYESKIRPQLEADSNLQYVGQLHRADLFALMSRADGLLFTSRWEEPFGLVMAESMAAGTPVITWRRGAAPEIITHVKTGFLLPYEDMVAAAAVVPNLEEIDRATCRRHIEDNFSWARIIEEYEDYYYSML